MSSINNTYIRSITDSFPDELSPIQTVETNSTSFFSNITWQTWLIVLLILTLIGFNVFYYLEQGTITSISFVQKILDSIFTFLGETTKQTVETSSIGAKKGIDVLAESGTKGVDMVADTTVSAIDNVSDNLQTNNKQTNPTNLSKLTKRNINTKVSDSNAPMGQQAKTSYHSVSKLSEDCEDVSKDSLDKALEDASRTHEVEPHDTYFTSGKQGWCFIGEDRGVRSCSEIGVNDRCMSGDIFPTQQVCMNPNLRP